MLSAKEQFEMVSAGAAEIIPEAQLLSRLEESCRSGRPLRVKCGIDPTGADVHIGHTLPMLNMRSFQDAGHTGVVIIGDYTATIGDPTGRDETRPHRSLEDVQEDGRGFVEQLRGILHPERTEFRWQSEWFPKMHFEEILDLLRQASVQQLLAHETFRLRLDQHGGFRVHELMYPLLQGYDSIAIEADVELGDPAQKFNILMGRAMQKARGMREQIAFLNPILMGLDGQEKMSKSLGNYVALTDSPEVKFARLMSISDDAIEHYLHYAARMPRRELEERRRRLREGELSARELKLEMATLVVGTYHGAAETAGAREAWERGAGD